MRTVPPMLRALLVASGAMALTAVACAASERQFLGDAPPGPGLVDQDASPPPPPSCQGLRCSRDLKKVLRGCEGEEEVVKECGPDEGCGDGNCVDPCTSAELSKGSIGCSFRTLPPDNSLSGSAGSCFAAMIANTWDRPVTISAALGAEPLDITASTYFAEKTGGTITYTRVEGPLPPGKVALVFLAQGPSPGRSSSHSPCPPTVVPAFAGDPIAHGTARTRAFRLTTDAPVSAYSIYPYGGADSYFPTATLLLPISSWGKNYLAVNAWAASKIGSPTLQIVADEDDTEVRMRPGVDVYDGNGVTGTAKGATQTWTLSRGEVLQITQPEETSGSPIETTKPVGVFGGSECTYIPASQQACDATQQQIPPISAWGSEYALVPYRPRIGSGVGTNIEARETVPWRLVGAVNGTKLTYDPARPLGAPETLEAGQVVNFMTDQLVTVRSQDSQHPFYAAVFMTGAQMVGGNNLGDPDFVNVVPSDQFLDRYVFFTDYTYPETTLTLVRRRTTKGFHPVTVECAGEITDWKPLGNAGQYEYAWVHVTEGGVPKPFGVGTCGYGRHEARSTGPFSVSVWGTGYCASYGYAGGMGSRPINDTQVPVVN